MLINEIIYFYLHELSTIYEDTKFGVPPQVA